MSVFTRERVILGLLVVALLSTVIGVVAYFVPKTKNHADTISELREQIGRQTVPTSTKYVDSKTTTHIMPTSQPVATATTSKPSKKVFDTRIDCIPESKGKFVKATHGLCNQRGCIYDDTRAKDVPVCYHGDDRGYRVIGHSETQLGLQMVLESKGRGPFGNDIQKAVFDVEMWDENIIRFKFDDPEFSRYKVPLQINTPVRKSSSTAYEVKIINRKTFAFQIIRKATGKVLWDTSVGGLVLSDQFLQISTKLPSKHIYGFGENLHQRLHHDLNWRTWPMFALSGNVHNTPTGNHYGVHPFYTCMEDDGNSHGVFLLNSNAMDYSFTPLPMLTYRTIGGVLDFYMFLGPTPENVIQQYTGIVGRSYMPPYWALGFQLSRYGYKNTAHMKTAIDRTKKYRIPLDVQYIDIDYKDQYLEFTLDSQRFDGIAEYFTSLRKGGMRTVVILDPPLVSNISDYEPYDRLSQVEGAVKWPDDYNAAIGDKDSTNAMLGYNRPVGKVVYPDFLNNRTGAVWADLIVKHSSRIPFDGIWIDMNEPENYNTNEARPRTWPEGATPYWTLDCPTNNRYEEPPYRTMAGFVHDTPERASGLSDGTLCMVGRQGDYGQYRHYDVHSLYGWSQAPPTLKGVQRTTGGRGFVLSRSTYPGSGKYASHWLGDGKSLWPDMVQSIIGMLEFNLFGIPHVGADICGYEGNPTPELCKRWIQLGAFYPYSRSHSRKVDSDQDPGYFGDDVATAAREAIETRYWLLPYLYTLFHKAHVTGDTVARPVFHEFPGESFGYEVDGQFMWGPHLMIVPILQENTDHVLFYQPYALWYDYYTGSISGGTGIGKVNVGSSSKIPLFVRAGAILPMQQPANNTHFSRRNPMKLLVALKNNSTAEGELFWDDGESIDTYESGSYFYAKFKADKFSVSMVIEHGNFDVSSLYFNGITLYGAPTDINRVTCNATRVSFNYEINNDSDDLKSVLIISNVSIPLNKNFAVLFRYDDW